MIPIRVFAVLVGVAVLAFPASGADVNEDGQVNEDDALVMYYAYALGTLLGDGDSGGVERFRRVLLGARGGDLGSGDDALRGMLRRANVWGTVGAPISAQVLPRVSSGSGSGGSGGGQDISASTCDTLVRRYCGAPPRYPQSTTVPPCTECVFLELDRMNVLGADVPGVYGYELFDGAGGTTRSEEYDLVGNTTGTSIRATVIGPGDGGIPSGYFDPES